MSPWAARRPGARPPPVDLPRPAEGPQKRRPSPASVPRLAGSRHDRAKAGGRGGGARLGGTRRGRAPDGHRRTRRRHLRQRLGAGRRDRPGHAVGGAVRPADAGRRDRCRPHRPAGPRHARPHQRAAHAPGRLPHDRGARRRAHPRRARDGRLHARRRTAADPLHGRGARRTRPGRPLRHVRHRRAGREHAPRARRPHRLPPAEPRHRHPRHHARPGLRPHGPAGVDVPSLADRVLAAGPVPESADPGAAGGGGERLRDYGQRG